ncbi:MAG: hypothetical protein GY854_34145 [Deltaproteobacteria bacterium]|nr:hypothetical protein [Deltaproteobacteria bacterium]
MKKLLTIALVISLMIACTDNNRDNTPDGSLDDDTGQDTGGDSDTDADSDNDGDAGANEDSGFTEIIPDCGNCVGVGKELDNMLCAIDLCDPNAVLTQDYSSPKVKAGKLARSRAAIERFGDAANDLEPLLNGSYAVISTGFHDSKIHNDVLNDGPLWNIYGQGVEDPFAPTDEVWPAYDVVEWKIRIKAPSNANGFRLHYVFFSAEYEEYIDSFANDKFYIFIEGAKSTNNGARTVTNFAECRNPSVYSDFTCSAEQAAAGTCKEDEKYCFIAINTAFSECCWHNGCTEGVGPTNIDGTGFECGDSSNDYLGDYSQGHKYGSSTGWLYTEWPVEPGEEFSLIFHLHDTADGIYDSQVIIDKFLFVSDAEAGTGPMV